VNRTACNCSSPPNWLAAGGGADQQAASDGREREQHDHQPGGQPNAAAQHATHPRRRLVLLDDLDLAVVATLDHGSVVAIDETLLGMEVVHQAIVGLRILDAVIDPNERHQRVNRHRPLLSCATRHRRMLIRRRPRVV